MAEVIKISTGKYTKQGKVEIDGHVWEVKLLGAGSEMRFSQAVRKSKLYANRMKLLEPKIDIGEANETELDQYEEYCREYDESEKSIIDIFCNVFTDNTPDNSEVRKWLNETPTWIIEMTFNDVQQKAGETDGREEPTESS